MITDTGFVQWLLQQVDRDDPIGDLARDVREDRRAGCLSLRVRSARGIKEHLESAHGVYDSDGAMRAFDAAVKAHQGSNNEEEA
jgi:hypothetical protein